MYEPSILKSNKNKTHATPAKTASQPQSRPMTSTTKAREWLYAVELMLSIASQMRCNAVGAPMVRSVNDMSLSIEPTKPQMRRWECFWSCASVMIPGKDGNYQGYEGAYINELTLIVKFLNEVRPFRPEDVGTC